MKKRCVAHRNLKPTTVLADASRINLVYLPDFLPLIDVLLYLPLRRVFVVPLQQVFWVKNGAKPNFTTFLMSLIDGVCWIFCIFARESVRERAAPRQNEQVLLLSACTVVDMRKRVRTGGASAGLHRLQWFRCFSNRCTICIKPHAIKYHGTRE